jgi:hypothetical protein
MICRSPLGRQVFALAHTADEQCEQQFHSSADYGSSDVEKKKGV